MSAEEAPSDGETPGSAAKVDEVKRRDTEYYYIQDLITSFNKDCLEIKKWSVTAASIVTIVGQSSTPSYTAVFLTVAALAAAFWVTEAVWRLNQWAFVRSVREIEEGLETGPSISARWAKYYIGETRFWRWWMRRPDNGPETMPLVGERTIRRIVENFVAARTFLPHGLICLAALGLAAWFACHPEESDPSKPDRIEITEPVQIELSQ